MLRHALNRLSLVSGFVIVVVMTGVGTGCSDDDCLANGEEERGECGQYTCCDPDATCTTFPNWLDSDMMMRRCSISADPVSVPRPKGITGP